MKSVSCKALLLLLLAKLALTGHPEGSHSLRYLQTYLAEPGYQDNQLICSVYMDDIHVERFNSREENPKLEHCAPWVDQQEPEYWESETKNMLGMKRVYDVMYTRRLLFYKTYRPGYQSFQILMACYVGPGGKFSHGQYELFFRDQDEFIVLNEDLRTWTAVGKAAEIMRQEWKRSGFTELVKTFLETDCVQVLLQKLKYGKIFLLRKDAPKIHVTHKSITDQKITLRCWAMNFYPAEISLTWKDENNQTVDMEVIETRSSGDGTFQKWAAVVVPSGEEQRYTCHVNHVGLPEPITVKWEPPQPSVPIMPIVTGMVLGAVLIGAVVTFVIWKRITKAGLNS